MGARSPIVTLNQLVAVFATSSAMAFKLMGCDQRLVCFDIVIIAVLFAIDSLEV
jgi:hypothetical protein